MTAVAWSIAYVVILLSIGLATTALIVGARRRSILEIVALVILLGAGVLGTLLFWISLLGFRPDRAVILTLGIVSFAGNAIFVFLHRLPRVQWPRLSKSKWENIAMIPPILLLLGAGVVCLIVALGFDTFEWDSWVMWGMKAKVFYQAALSPRPAFFGDVTFSFAHPDYPPLLPMLIAGAYGMMRQINEPLGKIVLPLLYAGQTLLIYLAARRWLGRFSSLLLAVILICAPFSVEHSGIGNADTVLTTFYLGSVFYLMRWMDSRDIWDIALSALFCVFVATTKSEGLPIALINGLVLLLLVVRQKRDGSHLGIFAIIFTIGAGIWWVWRRGIPHTHDDYFSRATWPIFAANVGRIGMICREIAKNFTDFSQWGCLWLLLPFMMAVAWRGFARPQARVLWTLLILQLALYVFVYIITDWDVKELLDVTSGRLLLHVAPIVVWLTAIHWSAAISESAC